MADGRVERRLAAILSADVAGYSRLMGADEEGTLAALTAHRTELIEPCIAEHRGRVVKTTGDGLLAAFASVVDAVRCAVAFQEGMRERNAATPDGRRIAFRIGVNLGDVIVQGDDVYGDGVNVAARLEGLADPGEVNVSGTVHEHVRGKLALDFDDLGLQRVKNITEPVHVYRAVIAKGAGAARADTQIETVFRLPSIAVLPFENVSGEAEQEYFSDGITEDLITALTRIRRFRVVARNSTFSFKGRSPDIRRVARELDAQYVIEGSVRKAGNRIRLTAQLIDGETGKHVWAERYDRDLDDIFVLQDELTIAIAAAVAPAMNRAEQERVKRRPPDSLDAWESYQQGLFNLYKRTKEDMAAARRMFRQAMTIDPLFAPAYAGSARTYFFNTLFGFTEGNGEDALSLATKAVELDPDDAEAHLALGLMHYIIRDNARAIPEFETALSLDPTFATAHHSLGSSLAQSGRCEEALPHLFAAIRLSPKDGDIAPFHARIAMAYLYLRQHAEAAEWARKSVRLPGTQWPAHCFLVAALAHLDRADEARKALEDLVAFRPGITVGFVRDHLPTADRGDLDHLLDGLRKAGLSE